MITLTALARNTFHRFLKEESHYRK